MRPRRSLQDGPSGNPGEKEKPRQASSYDRELTGARFRSVTERLFPRVPCVVVFAVCVIIEFMDRPHLMRIKEWFRSYDICKRAVTVSLFSILPLNLFVSTDYAVVTAAMTCASAMTKQASWSRFRVRQAALCKLMKKAPEA